MTSDNLQRTRLVAGLLALIVLTSEGVQVVKAGPTSIGVASLVALGTIAALLLLTAVRRESSWWDVFALPVLMVALGLGLPNPLISIGLAIAVLAHQSLYGSTRAWVVRSALGTVAVPVIVAFSHAQTGMPPAAMMSSTLFSLPQVLMMCGLTRALYRAMTRQGVAKVRDAVLARSGQLMLAATDVSSVYAIAGRTADELVALNDGLARVVARAEPDGLRIRHCAGLDPDLGGQLMPRTALTDPAGFFSTVTGTGRVWVVRQIDDDRYSFLGHPRAVPAEVLDAFQLLDQQTALAEASRVSHQELDHQANHDHLTQLPNRAKFFQALTAAVDRGPAGSVALLNIDLDDFKRVNDTYGHSAGDELLVEVAVRIAAAGGGAGLGGRFGGDEFALLLTGLQDPTEAERLARRLCADLVAPVRLAAATVDVGASIGLAVVAEGVTAAELMRQADIAMYSAKAHGKNRVDVFSIEAHGEVARHRKMEDQLSHAIGRGEIETYFQPYLNLRTGAWAGVEAYATWKHPTLGDLPCRELLALAGRTGNIPALSSYILRTVVAQLRTVPALDGVRVGLNLGAQQLLEPGFTDTVLATLTECGFPPAQLTLEIVESAHLDDPAARTQLDRLTAAGVRISLDEFGTGYVSLASLRSFPIHQLKIDGSFLTGDPAALDLVLSVGELLGTEVVVLGVRTLPELERLRGTTATAVQGELIAPVAPAAELARVLSLQPQA